MVEKRFSSGSVITMDAVPEEHQVGIAWYANKDGKEIGFVYDEDVTDPAEIQDKVVKFCVEKELRPFGEIEFIREVQTGERKARIEEISQELFLTRFGGTPRDAYVMLDEGGTIDRPETLFGVPAEAELEAHKALRNEMAQTSGKAAAAAAGIMAIGAVVVLVAAYFLSCISNLAFPFAALVLFNLLFCFAGVICCIGKIPDLAHWCYRKFWGKQ